jgi:hypothetical protein
MSINWEGTTPIDLQIDDGIPKGVKERIIRLAQFIFQMHPSSTAILAQIASQICQSIYYVGNRDGHQQASDSFLESLENFGREPNVPSKKVAVVTHHDTDSECPMVQSGEWKYCHGHEEMRVVK